MKIFKIDQITLKPMIVLAEDYDDAVEILGHGFVTGLSQRPDADFDVVEWRPKQSGPARPLNEWAERGMRGIAWSVEGGWELVQTKLKEP